MNKEEMFSAFCAGFITRDGFDATKYFECADFTSAGKELIAKFNKWFEWVDNQRKERTGEEKDPP